MRRLLRVRDLEEEQSRRALESAIAERNLLEGALEASQERDHRGKRMLESSIGSGQLPDRLAGLEETRTASRFVAALTPKIAEAEADVVMLRQEFLVKRVERRQVETVIQKTGENEAIENARHAQQALDDWYANRLYSDQPEGKECDSQKGGPILRLPFTPDGGAERSKT